MTTIAEQLAAYSLPPRCLEVFAVTLDATFRAYDISALDIGGYTPDADGTRRGMVPVIIQAQTANLFFYFSSTDTASAASATAAQAAASAAAVYLDDYTAILSAGTQGKYILDRSRDKFLIVAGSAAGICRMFAAGPAF